MAEVHSIPTTVQQSVTHMSTFFFHWNEIFHEIIQENKIYENLKSYI